MDKTNIFILYSVYCSVLTKSMVNVKVRKILMSDLVFQNLDWSLKLPTIAWFDVNTEVFCLFSVLYITIRTFGLIIHTNQSRKS